MSDFLAMTEITQITASEGWPPWPPNNAQLVLNRNLRHVIQDKFAQGNAFFEEALENWCRPFVSICHGKHSWAFGSSPAGQPLEMLRGWPNGGIPCDGWKGIRIVWPTARRFASSVVMAKMCEDNVLESLEGKSKRPTKGCLGPGANSMVECCHTQSEAIFIEPYDPSNPEHKLMGEHKWRECPECFRLGDRCSKLARMNRGTGTSNSSNYQSALEPWMRGRIFRATEGGLETTITFESIEVRVLFSPDVFALDGSVWKLAQEALARNSKTYFDISFKLLTDRTSGDENPRTLAHVFLLLNYFTKPKPTDLQQLTKEDHRKKTKDLVKERAAVNVAASVEIVNVLTQAEQAVSFDVEQRCAHFRQKNAIAEVLLDQVGVDSEPKIGDPHGWICFALRTAEEWNRCDVDQCFHGTSMTALAPILVEGLKRPTCKEDVAHGQGGSRSRKTIYLSPSWHYSAHPVYSPLHVFSSGNTAFQMVLKCEVKQGRYQKQKSTLGNQHWPKDLRIDPDRATLTDMEYLVEDEGAVRVTDVMFRKFGKEAEEQIYGHLPPRLEVHNRSGLEYDWTNMLEEHFRSRELYLEDK